MDGGVRLSGLSFCLLSRFGDTRRTLWDRTPPCERAGSDAGRQYALPAGLLGAIGKVESGRWDRALGRVVPSPWAIDASGQSYLADNKTIALEQLHALHSTGVRNIDVGCFQINLLSHPAAFDDLEQAFDPTANAQYAARFLASLHSRLGNWEDAVAAYHSRHAVTRRSLSPGRLCQLVRRDDPAPRMVNPVAVFSFGGNVIHVWSPSAVGSAASVIAITGPAASRCHASSRLADKDSQHMRDTIADMGRARRNGASTSMLFRSIGNVR